MDTNVVKNFYEKNKYADNIVAWVFMSNLYPLVLVPVRLNLFTRIGVLFYMRTQFFYRDKLSYGEKKLYKLFNNDKVRIYKMMPVYGVGKKKIDVARKEYDKFLDAYGTEFEILWSRESIEFMKKGVNKANALKKFIDVLKINSDEVAVAGDSGNDIPLFENFSNSYVMKHAPEEVKSKAKVQIDGVYCINDYVD